MTIKELISVLQTIALDMNPDMQISAEVDSLQGTITGVRISGTVFPATDEALEALQVILTTD